MTTTALPKVTLALRTAWDAIRVPRFLATQAMQRFCGEPGPILVHPAERALYFLVPEGTVAAWRVDGTEAVEAAALALPQPHQQRPPGPYWLLSPARRPCTDPSELQSVLNDVMRDLAVVPHV